MTRIVYTGTRAPEEVGAGVELHHVPMLETVPRPLPSAVNEALGDGARPRFAIFYSRNAADHVFEALTMAAFDGCEVWAVGEKTAKVLSERLGRAVRSPRRENFEGLVEELRDVVHPGALVVSFELASTDHPLAEMKLRGEVLSVPTYETVAYNYDDLDSLLRRIDPKWVLFASPRAYEAFRRNLHHRPVGDSYRVAAIGPTTHDAIVEAGDRVDFVPEKPDLVETLRQLAER